MAFSEVVNGAWTHKRQMEIDWVKNVRCQQCGKEGSEYNRLFECVAQER